MYALNTWPILLRCCVQTALGGGRSFHARIVMSIETNERSGTVIPGILCLNVSCLGMNKKRCSRSNWKITQTGKCDISNVKETDTYIHIQCSEL